MSTTSELPELGYDEIPLGRRFQDTFLNVTPTVVRDYATAVQNAALAAQADGPTGTALDDPSLLIIFGITRRVLGKDLRVPAGGVLASQTYEFRRPLRLGERVRTETTIAEKYEKRGRRYLVLRCEMYGEADDPIGRVDSHVIWAR